MVQKFCVFSFRPCATAVTAPCTLPIKAIPNAPRSAVVGWLGEVLKAKVHAPLVEGRANEALCEFLAKTLGLPVAPSPCSAAKRRARNSCASNAALLTAAR